MTQQLKWKYFMMETEWLIHPLYRMLESQMRLAVHNELF